MHDYDYLYLLSILHANEVLNRVLEKTFKLINCTAFFFTNLKIVLQKISFWNEIKTINHIWRNFSVLLDINKEKKITLRKYYDYVAQLVLKIDFQVIFWIILIDFTRGKYCCTFGTFVFICWFCSEKSVFLIN